MNNIYGHKLTVIRSFLPYSPDRGLRRSDDQASVHQVMAKHSISQHLLTIVSIMTTQRLHNYIHRVVSGNIRDHHPEST